MKAGLALLAAASLAACSSLVDFAAKQQAYNRQMGMSGMNDMTGQTKLDQTPDPAPHSASQDEQRRLYQENQDYQRALQAGQDRESQPAAGENCVETSDLTGSANSVSGTVTRRCH